MKRFYLDTALSGAHLDAVRQRIERLGVAERYAAVARDGIVVVLAAGGELFFELSEAERARRILLRGAPEVFGDAAVAFVESNGPARDTSWAQAQGPTGPLDMARAAVYVEDDAASAQAVTEILARLGMECVTVAEGGRQALMVIEDHEPDLILVGLQTMPDGMHGWELVKLIRENELIRRIPIIIVAGAVSEQDRVFAHVVAGARDYLPKPVDPVRLRRSVRDVLARYK
ncbi:MAG: response regulator [Anaerolineae bacterium]|nr:response regulator [Anaerolineae bacterium]